MQNLEFLACLCGYTSAIFRTEFLHC